MLSDRKLLLLIKHRYARISDGFFILDKVKEDLERAQECRATGGTDVHKPSMQIAALHVCAAIMCVSPHFEFAAL